MDMRKKECRECPLRNRPEGKPVEDKHEVPNGVESCGSCIATSLIKSKIEVYEATQKRGVHLWDDDVAILNFCKETMKRIEEFKE